MILVTVDEPQGAIFGAASSRRPSSRTSPSSTCSTSRFRPTSRRARVADEPSRRFTSLDLRAARPGLRHAFGRSRRPVLLRSRRARRRPRLRRRGGRARCRGLVVERALAAPRAAARGRRTRVRAMAPAADDFFGHPSEELEVAAVTGTNGKTTTTYPPLRDPRGGRAASRAARDGRAPRRRTRSRPAVNDARGDRPPADVPRDARRRRTTAASMEATSHGSEQHRLDGVRFAVLVFTNLTQDHLDFHGTMEAYFEAKRRLFAQDVPGGGQRRRTSGAAARCRACRTRSRTASRDDASSARRARRHRPQAARAVQRRERARRRGAPRGCSGSTRRRSRAGLEAVRGVPGRFESVDEGQPFAVVVDYSHTPDVARERPARGARARRRPRDLRVRLRRRPRPRQASRSWAGSRRARRRRDRHLRQSRAARSRRRSSRRSSPGCSPALEVEPDRSARDRARYRAGRSRATSS